MHHHLSKPSLAVSIALGLSASGSHAAVIFTDNFDIPDTGSLDGSVQAGRHTGMLASNVVLRSGGIQHTISGGQLNVLTPPFGRVRFQDAGALPGNSLWNFASGAAGAQILADGGFRFEFDWTPPNNTTDDWVCLNVGFNYLDTAVGATDPSTDFGLLIRNNGSTKFFDNSVGGVSPTFDVTNVTQRHAAIDFSFSSYADGSSVTANFFVDNVAVGAPVVFDWSGNGGVINIEMAANNNTKRVDNISISTIPEPSGVMLLGLAGVIATGRRRRK